MPETQWMTLMETADMMKRLPDQVTQMCEDGKLEYYVEDGRYFVSRESIDLFMHPPIDQPATVNPDSNGTLRRQYGRAPQDIEPSPESSSESQAGIGPDEVNAAGGPAPEDDMEETSGRGDEIVETAEDAQPGDDPAVTDHEETVEYLAETAEDPVEAEDAQPAEDLVEAEGAEGAEDPNEHTEAAADPGEPDMRAAEILADLRVALTRHAREHKAFCDEIAALADALESTLSHDGDKTSELTREISSLLARYTRR
ncbi:MAG: hypothetical protein OXI19_07865 [Gemmatimonadota bacterium]|nr:hypothetical protein [Gemmatimonadota bacterium]